MVMDPGALAEAARVLIEARRKGRLAEQFPLASRPTDADEADAIQQAVTAGLGERVAGWKVRDRGSVRSAARRAYTFAAFS